MPRNKFERNNVDVFEVPAVSLGALKRLRIWHDNKGGGAAWHLNKVVVTDPTDGKEYTFMCDEWLSKRHGNKQTSRELGVQDDVPEELRTKAVTATYDVAVHTADVKSVLLLALACFFGCVGVCVCMPNVCQPTHHLSTYLLLLFAHLTLLLCACCVFFWGELLTH